jgi:capsular exopolysaccharide synthesis family protein
MELRTYLQIFERRKWVIALTAIITITVAVVGTLLTTPVYEASTTLRIPTARRGSADWVDYDVGYADRLMNTYARITTSGPALNELAKGLNLDQPPKVDVENLANSELMQITVEDPNPVLTRDAANALAAILITLSTEQFAADRESAQGILSQQLVQLEDELSQARQEYASLVTEFSDDPERLTAAQRSIALKEATYGTLLEQYDQARIRDSIQANIPYVIEPAEVPQTPSNPNLTMNIALGLLVGLVGGIGLAFLFENLDTKLYTTAHIQETTDLPTLVSVPTAGKQWQAGFLNGESPEGEAFRRLRTRILNLDQDQDGPLRSLAITSAVPGEGKSTVVASLAYAMAQTERRVIVVDGNLRRPTLHKIFELPNQMGLSTVLSGETTLDEAVQQSKIPWLFVLTSGTLPSEPALALGSPRMATVIEQLTQQFDWLYLDTPSLLAVTDAALLAPLVDGVVLVVGYAQARVEAVQVAYQQLTDVGAHSIGIVVNRADQDGGLQYYYPAIANKA